MTNKVPPPSTTITGGSANGGWITVTGSGGNIGFGAVSYNPFYFDSDSSETIVPAPPKPQDFKDGCTCIKCKELYPFAIPSEKDGITLICWACKNGY